MFGILSGWEKKGRAALYWVVTVVIPGKWRTVASQETAGATRKGSGDSGGSRGMPPGDVSMFHKSLKAALIVNLGWGG